MPTSILILPGINDSGSEHWQTAWEGSVAGARRVPARDWNQPSCVEWVAALEQAVADAGPDVVLVAHSLGCLQVVHWAMTTRLSVRGAMLVALPDPEGPAFPSVAVGFAPVPLRRLPFPSTLVVSADDPYAHPEFARRCAEQWGSRYVDIGNRGHINADSGLGEWPEGRQWLETLMGTSNRPATRPAR